MAELKPCPFCGGNAKFVESYRATIECLEQCVFVMCGNCLSRTQSYVAGTDYCAKDKAAEVWNTRYTGRAKWENIGFVSGYCANPDSVNYKCTKCGKTIYTLYGFPSLPYKCPKCDSIMEANNENVD